MVLAQLWTRRRATLAGSLAALAALLLWPAFVLWQGPVRLAFAAALAVTLLSGGTLMLITLWDLATVRRGRRLRPARLFDLVYGLALAGPAGLFLAELLG